MKIAISGKSGCGNSTASELVASELGLRLINYTFKSIAVEEGVSFEEICRRAELNNDMDYRVDRRQVEMAEEGDCVLGSRLAIWLLESADLKVYLEAGLDTRAHRIQKREGGDMEKVLEQTAARDERDQARYLRLYSIDTDEYGFADVVIHTDGLTAEQVAAEVARHARERIQT